MTAIAPVIGNLLILRCTVFEGVSGMCCPSIVCIGGAPTGFILAYVFARIATHDC